MGTESPLARLRLRRRTDDPSRRRFRRGVYVIPSLFTLANLFCGYACVIYSMRGEYATAAPFIGFAIVLDMLDGRIARMTGTASEFGLQFDSLADIVSFGVAPAILSFAWGLSSLGRMGWAAAFLFVTAAALRLARFNIQGPSGDKRYFVGMPSPAAAGVPAATVYLFPDGLIDERAGLAVLAMVIVPALLMVSTIRYRSFKTLDLQARRPFRVLLLFALLIALVVTHPQLVLVSAAYIYLASGLVGWLWGRFFRRASQHDAPAVSTPAPVTQPPPETAATDRGTV